MKNRRMWYQEQKVSSKRCFIMIAGALLLGCYGMSGAEVDRIDLLSDALRARAMGDYVGAKEIIEALLEIDPGNQAFEEELQFLNEALGETGEESDLESSETPLEKERSKASDPDFGVAEIDSDEVNGHYLVEQRVIAEMLKKGRAQLVAGDLEGAKETFGAIEARDPNHAEAKKYQVKIAKILSDRGDLDRIKTKEQMLQNVAQGWQRPQVFDREYSAKTIEANEGLREKLSGIVLPRVNFNGVNLSRVVDTLSALSEEYDAGGGINIVLIDPSGTDPKVNITLRGLSMERILDFTVESVGYEYDVQLDAVVVRQGQGTGTRLETEFFPISRSTIIRLTGVDSSIDSTTRIQDPFALGKETDGISDEGHSEESELRHFLQRAGVPFEAIEGANLALADGQLIVTQTPRNIEKVRNILRRYNEVKQVEIEARFLEVRQGDLDELGFDWTVSGGKRKLQFNTDTGLPIINADGTQKAIYDQNYATTNRSLGEAFGISGEKSSLKIARPETQVIQDEVTSTLKGIDIGIPILAPVIPNNLDLGTDVGSLASISGVIGNAQVSLLIRALERETGNDLMSAPKVTVLSGKTAEIVVAQEFRYPESYGNIEAEVGSSTSGDSGSAGVAITAGTPQDFQVRNVGVEMSVTPTVEDDNSISLLLEPRVTEFEGFVEYGGQSVAIAANTTVTVPSGFFQPIFSVRRVRTEVTIWDGSTVVMGGLTREQAVSVKDKVPFLGDIPLLGRLFRSEGKSSEKRNLLIFVTANMISPGGSPQWQEFRTVDPGSLYQNPTIVTPGGAVNRGAKGKD